MNPPSSFTPDGSILGLNTGASHAPPPITSWPETSTRESTVEANLLVQIESLRQDMAKMQDHTNILSSKVRNGLEQIMHHRQEQSLKSVPKPSGSDMGKQMVAAKPSTS
ncbi:hypothetical protein L3X38_004468 [Prunus dulcis]|uniref:Uncharacterized protein n=1 Tax=Prunus dulcis TaxID=3755 RepID=A0AAD4ZNW2_PRUDU|nr:hypothetical protein L3X38_004468 [Prunus dulcis]